MKAFIAFFVFLPLVGFANPAKLAQVKSLPIKESALPGYNFDTDQAFQITSGPLKDKFLFFASRELGSTESKLPRFVLSDTAKVLESIELPLMQEGWNLVAVKAVSSLEPKSKSHAARIIAILTLEPASNRESDYWDQPYVFDVSSDGKIEPNLELNQKMELLKPRPKRIKEIKKFLGALKNEDK